MAERLVLAGCGGCDHAWRTPEVPAACPECGADFGADAPLALLWIGLTSSTEGARLRMRVGERLELRGAWDADRAAEARRAMFRVVDGGR